MPGTLHTGTSGFDFPQWKGSFYPAGIRQRDMLAFYAGRLRSVEINYTFRREVTKQTFRAWRDATPDGFTFALKAHQLITHWRRLAGAQDLVDGFIERARTLGPKLGPVLFQCPPNLRFDRALLDGFLEPLPGDVRFAFEFRHPSWVQARETLAARGVAWCLSDTGDQPIPDQLPDAGPFAYLRLRRDDYPPRDLKAWAGRIAQTLRGGVDVFAYFKHEEGDVGPRFAARLAKLAGGAPS